MTATSQRYGAGMAAGEKPILWHLRISHYSEKVRWALDHKGVEHERKAPPPPGHIPVALVLTRGKHYTLPIMRIDGRIVGDSTAIISALEERYPDRPLYPEDPADRARALELEEYFDEELGPSIRRIVWHEVTHDRESLERVAAAEGPPVMARFKGAASQGVKTFLNLRYGAKEAEGAAEARRTVLAALYRLEAELDGGDHLVGDTFTVADLTAAALFYPVVRPPEGPKFPHPPRSYEEWRAQLEGRPGFGWVERTFQRHRVPTLVV